MQQVDDIERIWPSIGLEFVYRGNQMSMSKFKIKVKDTIKETIRGYAEINGDMKNLDKNTEAAFKKLKFNQGKSKVIKEHLFVSKKYKTGVNCLIALN